MWQHRRFKNRTKAGRDVYMNIGFYLISPFVSSVIVAFIMRNQIEEADENGLAILWVVVELLVVGIFLLFFKN